MVQKFGLSQALGDKVSKPPPSSALTSKPMMTLKPLMSVCSTLTSMTVTKRASQDHADIPESKKAALAVLSGPVPPLKITGLSTSMPVTSGSKTMPHSLASPVVEVGLPSETPRSPLAGDQMVETVEISSRSPSPWGQVPSSPRGHGSRSVNPSHGEHRIRGQGALSVEDPL